AWNLKKSTSSAASMRPQTTPGTGTGLAFSRVLLSPLSDTTGSSTTRIWPTLDTPSVEATRNSRTPSAASAATVSLSLTERTTGLGASALGAGSATTSA